MGSLARFESKKLSSLKKPLKPIYNNAAIVAVNLKGMACGLT
jgi:hypothetical protein